MTKDELLKLIEERGEFWYISNYWCSSFPHGDDMVTLKKDSYSNLDKHIGLIDKCLRESGWPGHELVQIDNQGRLFLLERLYNQLQDVNGLIPIDENTFSNHPENYEPVY